MQRLIRLTVIAVCAVMLVALQVGCKSGKDFNKGIKKAGQNVGKGIKKATKRR